MTKNVTLRLDDELLKKARHLAIEQDQSLSQLMAGLLEREVQHSESFEAARERALRRLREKIPMKPGKWSREELHERGADLR